MTAVALARPLHTSTTDASDLGLFLGAAYLPPQTETVEELMTWRSLDEPSRPAPIQDRLPWETEQQAASNRRISSRREGLFERQPTSTADLPPAAEFCARMAVAALEVAAGSRPAAQMLRHCETSVFDSLVRRQTHHVGRAATRRPMVVRRVRACHVCDGIVEAAVIVADVRRIRPVALRIEGLDGRWLVTALEAG